MENVNFAELCVTAGGRHKAFVLARLMGLSNGQVAELAGNAGGAPTVAFALTQMRKKHGISGLADKDCSQLAAALGLAVAAEA